MSTERTSDGLSFNQVRTGSEPAGAQAIRVDVQTHVSILGIIFYHNLLPKNEKGVAPITLRELTDRYGTAELNRDALLKEFVCAFGAHAEPVVRRAASKLYCAKTGVAINSEEALEFAKKLDKDARDYMEKIKSELGEY